MPAPLRCPTCHAPLDIPPEHATTARCSYCGAGVLLTERGGHVQAAAAQQRHADAIADVLAQLRAGSVIGAIKVYRDHFGVGLAEAKHAVERLQAGQSGSPVPPRTGTGSTRGPRMIGLGLAVLTIFTLIYFQTRDPADAPATPRPAPAERLAPAVPAPPVAAGPPPFAEPVLRFGGEGTGAGRFEDARSVAVDGAGRIYVAEYSGGRVQVFDSAGTFVTQWMADPRMPLVDMAADRGGTVYIVQSGRIRRYEGATGRALGEFPRPQRFGYDDVTVALDGSLWAATQNGVVHLDRDGGVRRTVDLKRAVDEDASPERVAVDGNGHLFVLDRWKGDIYHLDPDGKFIDRFAGGDGGPGGAMTPEDIAIDGRGRVYVSDMGTAIRVFDPSGRVIGTFGGSDVVFGLAFNDRDELFASHRNKNQVVKYRLAD
jgi:streptogramin lyase/DNA-directed RNA polymerase subunit RPC12/RpoP